jgi:hypothetical protein
MKRIFAGTLVLALMCFLTSCGAAQAESQQVSSSLVDAAPSSVDSVAVTSDSGSAAEEEYSVAFLNHEVTTMMQTITALEDEMTSAKEFGPNIWDYVETYYADYENQCIWFCVYDTEVEDEIRAALGDPDYLQFTYIEPATIQAQVLSCGAWNQETGRQPIQMVTLDSNEIFEAGQEISIRVESDAPLAFSEGDTVTVVHKISYDATDPPVVYAFDVSIVETAAGDDTFDSAFGLSYEAVEIRENGLLVAPEDGYEVAWDSDELKAQIGQDIATILDATVFPLSCYTGETTVAFYEDDTICWGAELVYTVPDHENASITIAFNPDHQVVRSYYYAGLDLETDYVSNVFASEPLVTTQDNLLNGTSVSLGHTFLYLGSDAQGGLQKADTFVASFQHGGVNYLVEAVSTTEADFLRIVYAILSV